MAKRVVIIGGRGGGAVCAARLRRLDESADITLVEREAAPFFEKCGLPYSLEEFSRTASPTHETWRQHFRIDLLTSTETLRIERERKEVEVRNVESGKTQRLPYDLLVLSPRAVPMPLSVEGAGLPGVFTLTAPDALPQLSDWLATRQGALRRAAVIGAGGLGLAAAEALIARGLETTLIDGCLQILPAMLDREMAALLEEPLVARGLTLRLGAHLGRIRSDPSGQGLSIESFEPAVPHIGADVIVLSLGTVPNADLARGAGLDVSPSSGGIRVDGNFKTSDPDIFAVGDVIEAPARLSEGRERLAIAGTSDHQARRLASILHYRDVSYVGSLRTSIVERFGAAGARVGLSEREARLLGIAHRAAWYPDSTGDGAGGLLALKVIFSTADGRVLGGQVIGHSNALCGVERRIDVLATALAGRMSVYDLELVELAYAPTSEHSGPTRDAINQLGSIAVGILRGNHPSIGWDELPAARQSGAFLIDVRTPEEFAQGSIPGAVNIPFESLRQRLGEVPHGRRIISFCQSGKHGYKATRILLQNGFDVVNLLGGYLMFEGAGNPIGIA
ncbi:MAG: FAD-dependent oxidoreductase [Myxococcales bacterium]|nr:FAD-dependent oxidoreductase [Myxococcales bacterium]